MPEYSNPITATESTKLPGMNGNTSGYVTVQAVLDFIRSTYGQANGLATLDGNGKLNASQVPEDLDDVLVYGSYALLPAAGEGGKLYITADDNKGYRWASELGTPAYVQLFDPAVITTVANIITTVANIITTVANIISGAQVVGKATADGAGNNIPNTYATKTELGAEITKIENGTTVAGKATADGDGNNIPNTYATKTELQGEIDDIEDGTTTAKKAECDADGNVIPTTYATKAETVRVQEVTGGTPSIAAQNNYRYRCGTVSTLTITAQSLSPLFFDVTFTSGSTPTVLTVPAGIVWANDFDPTALEADMTYELNIMDGVGIALATEVV